MTDRTEELKKEYERHHRLEKDGNIAIYAAALMRAQLKGRQEMRDEIRAWVEKEWTILGLKPFESMKRFDAKFGDKK